MRKDVKLGLAVGGVLLAVLVVYVLVGPGSPNHPGAELATGDSELAMVGPGAGVDATGSNGGEALAGNGGSGTSTQEQSGRTERTPGDSTMGDNASGARATASNGNPTGGSTPNGDGEKPTADTSWNWDALVNGGAKVPSLMSPAEVSTGGGTATPANGETVTNNNATTGGNPAGGANDIANDPTLIARGPVTDPTATPPGLNRPPAQPTVVPLNPTDNVAAPSTPAPAGARTHVVKSGETFSSIAAAAYGSANLYPHIQRANPSVEPSRLKPGMTLTLPSLDDVKPAAAAAVTGQQKIDSRSQYRVQESDNLYSISLKLYGKADRVEKLYELNKATIGDDSSRVKVGMILQLPEAPTQSTEAATAR